MKKRDIYLTGILLLLVGVSIGTIFALYTINPDLAPLSDVKITEVKKSETPLFTEEDLGKIDTRFVFKKIAEEVTPTVVYIETIIPVDAPDDENHDFSESLWDRIVPRRARTVGSGVVITSDGYILTNYHVIEGAVRNGLKVVLNDKREYDARLVGQDPSTDLAVIKIEAENIEAVTVGNSDSVDVGEWVLAIGNPFRLRSTVTAGIVSALSRDVQIINDRMRIESFIQTDAAINKGNSGGALVNTSGQLVGVNTAIASQSGAYQGYGFAVPSNLAIKVATDLIQYGEVRRALLGVSIGAVDFDRATDIGLDEVKGVEILSVSNDGAAALSGIRAGDVVLEVNGQPVNESNELQEKVAVLRPGDTVDLRIWRDGNELNKMVLLKMLEPAPEEQLAFEDESIVPDEIPEGENTGVEVHEFDLGFRVMALVKPENEEEYDLIITHVYKYSEAWNRGLRENQKIITIDEEKVEDIDRLKELINKKLTTNKSVMFEVLNEEDARGYIELERN
ncbi:MAG: trypsin-like peptidase domain-containing protein [Balneolaceae bacterium]|nr:trypsin-like peptidase domain-containing protein [Balneolaceae bacterium]MBO6546514.1 trypsin-like peptidase domain-containing protein [Balneolaceae bacterium]MBO6648873.1 trypsin-like peptidase domain-containing protein [Balneolaceae bacterium]